MKVSVCHAVHIFELRSIVQTLAQGIGDVSGDHEIQLGNWHHGRVASHHVHQKNHFRKYFPAI